MPLVVKTGYLNAKDENGQYIRNTTIAEQTTQEQVTEINTAGTANINAIEQKGVETLASIPDDYTELSGEVADLKSALEPAQNGFNDAFRHYLEGALRAGMFTEDVSVMITRLAAAMLGVDGAVQSGDTLTVNYSLNDPEKTGTALVFS